MRTLLRRLIARVWSERTYATHYKHWDKARLIGRFCRPSRVAGEEHRRLVQMRIDNVVDVTQPMVMISQISRSGGTLLSQLFDLHPQCHAHPNELHIGPDKTQWPTLNLSDGPDGWFRTLFEPPVVRSLMEGYFKGQRNEEQKDVLPCLLLPSLQKAIFDDWAGRASVQSTRDILNGYMTSYFNAWLDNHNLYGPPKKYVTAFAPRMNMQPASVDGFFRDYPEGWFISIIREPKSWYASAKSHSERSYGGERGIDLWIASTRAAVAAKQKFGERVLLLGFEKLLSDTEGVMRALAARLDIDFTPSLITPTFNGIPIRANSHFKVEGYGVNQAPLHRYRETLSADEIRTIDERTGELHRTALAMEDLQPASASIRTRHVA